MSSGAVLRAALGGAATLVLVSCGSLQSASGGDGAQHIAAANRAVGEILVDADGRTLYMSTHDEQGRASACAAECLADWPALEGSVSAGDGVDTGLIGTITRGDGTVQATYAGWPLYYSAEDTSAGDLNGQGVKDSWYVVSPEGDIITRAPASGGGGGY
jgi:predicted lipoprotein with Yx(FWY)xxD motif